MEITYRLIRSSRKSISVEITPEGEVLVRAPQRMPKYQIEHFLAEKSDWIETHRIKMKEKQKQRQINALPVLTREELQKLADRALADLPKRVAYYAPKVGVTYGRITIRNQKTRWGSCSSAGNLNFNCLLMLCPEEVRDYVVVHELCHRLEMNHSVRFWAQVERVLPDYKAARQYLKTNGGALIARMGR